MDKATAKAFNIAFKGVLNIETYLLFFGSMLIGFSFNKWQLGLGIYCITLVLNMRKGING